MEKEPKYEVGKKITFMSENGKLCCGEIVMATPVNYTVNYEVKMNLVDEGVVYKRNVAEENVVEEA